MRGCRVLCCIVRPAVVKETELRDQNLSSSPPLFSLLSSPLLCSSLLLVQVQVQVRGVPSSIQPMQEESALPVPRCRGCMLPTKTQCCSLSHTRGCVYVYALGSSAASQGGLLFFLHFIYLFILNSHSRKIGRAHV